MPGHWDGPFLWAVDDKQVNAKQQALDYLRKALDNPQAAFHDGQWESIKALLDRKRVLVVQRTGWGKSMVYFLATKLLREEGGGPTLLVSPLLSLMRDQLEATRKIGIRARAINSANEEEWEMIEQELKAGQADLLLISPERLANDRFNRQTLPSIKGGVGLLAVDEAHCISDWGHDFRPDYRRIVRVVQGLPRNAPMLATTATANQRVENDIKSQLGDGLEIIRGPLARKSLWLKNIMMPNQATRLAWLAEIIPSLTGSGIIYTLTQPDAERVAKWLKKNKINAHAYHADVPKETRKELERQLINNEVKALVATVALGMGFDKPDLGFVVHFQRPASVVHYYQQVGRAGRALDNAFGFLLGGEEDDSIADYFIQTAFPPQSHIHEILDALRNSNAGLSLGEIEKRLNLSWSQIGKSLKSMSIDSPAPIAKVDSKWRLTPASASYQVDQRRIDAIIKIRRREQQRMRDYMKHEGCLMKFLQLELDDAAPQDCGRCGNCSSERFPNVIPNPSQIHQAGLFLKRNHQTICPRKQWPANVRLRDFPSMGITIPELLRHREGRALCLWKDEGWGEIVAREKYETGRFSDDLVSACVEMLNDWNPSPTPQWICCVPSRKRPELVPDFAARLAVTLGLPFKNCVKKVGDNKLQKEMRNSHQQLRNLDQVFRIESDMDGECLLVDDMVDSRWTFAVVSALLRKAGCAAVYPLALARVHLGGAKP